MEGVDENWSNWNSETYRDFTNLGHGTYQFKVRARNLYGQLSNEASFRFMVSVPWHYTIWAYIAYVIIILFAIYAIVRWNGRRLIRANEALERTVEERTIEIAQQAAEIKKQNDRLEKMDQVKSRFFANISHELRTPLTLINGPLESLIDNDEELKADTIETLKTAFRNGANLSVLVEEILDLAKLEAGKLKLVENPTHIKEFIELLLSHYASGLNQKSISLDLRFEFDQEIAVMLDERKCKKVIDNLLSNALKFTPENGRIDFLVRESKQQGFIEIEVIDTGIGIHPEDLPYVFDRYYQSEVVNAKAEGGTGIGLALAKELAELLGGTLTVSSELGKGASFLF